MPELMINDCTMHYEEHGTGQNTVLFLHGLFMNSHMFNQQMVALRDRFRCVMVDLRGQGRSSAPQRGYDLKSVATDIIQFINVRRYGSCHIVGASMGGIIGMYIALEQPKLVKSLTLLGSTAEQSPSEDQRKLKSRVLRIKLFGMRFAMPGIINSLFSQEFLHNPANKAVTSHWRTEILKINRRSVVKVIAGVLQREGIFDQLFKIHQPALIIAGENDQATKMDVTHRLHNGIQNSKLVTIPGAGHVVNLEGAKQVNDELLEFLLELVNANPPQH